MEESSALSNHTVLTSPRYPPCSLKLLMSQIIQFDLSTEYVELCNLLKLVGLADSGGRGKTMVAEGLVQVDGLIEYRKTAKIRSGQTVVVNQHTINVK